MVHSMTAFARVERAGTQGTLSWELRSVNHRYLEPHLRLPESFRDLESAIREALRQGLSRGKVECTLRFVEETAGKPLQVDRERAAQLVAAAETVASLIKQPAALNPLEVLAWPGVLVADASDPQALNSEAMALFNEALAELKAGRGREGADLARLLEDRLSAMTSEVATLKSLVPQMLATQRQKVLDRFADMKAELDPQRLEQEMVRHRGAARAQGRRSGWTPPGFPHAGTESRSQYPWLQGFRYAQYAGGGQPQGVDRADA
jgi:uncharacterized protein (TIGR00255 family)